MKSTSKRKKKLLAAAAALALIAAASGTFAWITSQDQRINRASTATAANDTTTIVEDYDPVPLLPGTSTKKEVAIKNEGTMKTFARVSYEEVLKHLTAKGAVKYDDDTTVPTAKYTYVADDPGINKNMPYAYDANKVSSYTKVPASQIDITLPANVSLYTKGGFIINPSDLSEIPDHSQFVVHEYAPGKFQSMTADIKMANDNGDREDSTQWNFTVSDLKYGYFEGGYTHTAVNWAESSLLAKDSTSTTPDGNAVLGFKGERYGVKYDYTASTLGITLPGVTVPKIATEANKLPIPPVSAGWTRGVLADKKGLGKDEIQIGYSEKITDVTTLASKHWVYNEDDGWFYYTSPIAPNETTEMLLEKLIFNNLGDEYKNASYDLVVKMEAIQATPEALEDASTGWGMSSTGNTGAILTKLKAGLGS